MSTLNLLPCLRARASCIRAIAGLVAIALAALIGWPGPPGASAAGLANSPWPMFQHDAQHTGRSPTVGPSRLAPKWRAQVTGFPGGPAIGADGTIYVPTGGLLDHGSGSLYALDPDGSLSWRFQFPEPPNPDECRLIAGYATPAIDADGIIYVHAQGNYAPNGTQCAIGDDHVLFAINPNGTEKWRYAHSGSRSEHLTSPAIGSDGTIYFTDAALYAIDPAGTLDWAVVPTGAPTTIQASPAISPLDGTIYVSSFDLYAYEPNGAWKWTADTGQAAPNPSSPSVGSDGAVYGCFVNPGGYPDRCHAVGSAGAGLWSVVHSGGPTTPAIGADGTIHFTAGWGTADNVDGRVLAMWPSGAERWHLDLADRFGVEPFLDTPVIGGDGRLYLRADTDFGDTFHVLTSGGVVYDSREVDEVGILGDVSAAIGSDGTLYAPDPTSSSIFDYDPNANYLTAYGQGSRLSVYLSGGQVTGPGIDCTRGAGSGDPNDDCVETYLKDTAVTLVASPSDAFAGWSGACSGAGACVLSMDSDKSVTASFRSTPFNGDEGQPGDGDGGLSLKKAIRNCKKKFPKGKRRNRCIRKARERAQAG